MEVSQMIIELEISLDGANITWAHGFLLGITCISLIAVTFNRLLVKKHVSTTSKPVIDMVKMDVPFTISVDDGKEAIVRSSVANSVEIYWDYNIRKFYPTLIKRWSRKEPLLQTHMFSYFKFDNGEENDKTFNLYDEEVVRYSVPRMSFPVAVIVRNQKKNVKYREVLGLIAVIELGDPTNSSSMARIAGRYLKLGNGQVIPLQRYFASGLCLDNNTDMCVVCRDSPVTRVALPCRHACFCSSCFARVEKCSMCTAEIEAHFCIDPAVDDVD